MFGDLTETSNQGLNATLHLMKDRFFGHRNPNSDIELQNCLNQENAVLITNAFKNYGAVGVLHGLNMKVPKGTIYALLGASGCGKTTLLGCITGRKSFCSGCASVLGHKPSSPNLRSRIGYMPQETGLHGDFTIRETLQYFGRVMGMDSKTVKERTVYLIDLLMLPNTTQAIKELSGGQQRRVSLAVAFLHEPELLILDEPTVGVDPVLRELIWAHFLDITKIGNVTIIITTHYIEETAQADVIGLMRGGYLMAESSPEALLKQTKARSLEEAFLNLSIDQNQNLNGPRSEVNNWRDSASSEFPSLKIDHIYALAWKHALWLRKNFTTLIIVTMLPVFLVSLFCLTIGHDPINLKVAVVNYETRNKHCNDTLSCESPEISCHYLRYLNQRGLVLLPYESEQSAVQSVQKGETYASIVIKKNYSRAMHARAHHWQNLKITDLEQSSIDVVRDVSTKHIALYIQVYLYQSFEKFFYEYIDSCGINKREMTLPLQWEIVYGKMNPNFTDFSIPGILLSLAFIVGVILTAWAMFIERNEASLDRNLVMGVNKIELLVSHIVVEFVMMVVQMILTMACTFILFGMTIKGSLLLTAILLSLTGLCGICFGLLTSCITNSQTGITLISVGTYFSVTLTSGLIWPIEAMHPWLQQFAVFFPLTKATESLRNILHRDWGFLNQDVYVGFLTVSAWSLIFLLISIVFIKFQRD
ncbi:hypothetical protein RN001_011209 [Aquatica leii]|uniref:ABC transporter domain-containing protein n=1 Tax=Aquatica leii TaxID=1421715 RepID=A0AAN7QHZ7_9COLE|nr:hypothetical protein RN001_011209 [Aquatica leii]